MAEFKLAIADPSTRKTYKKELKGADAEKLVGKKIGDKFRGELLDLPGYEFQITGGSDKAGFPMRSDLRGQGRKKILLSKGVGFKPKNKGQRKKRTVHGNTISPTIVQVNVKVTKAGAKKLTDVFKPAAAPKEGEAKPAEAAPAPAEAPKAEEKKEEPKAEEKPAEKPKEEAKPEEKKE